jgi:O-antigen/teichoic acid export membrane protein
MLQGAGRPDLTAKLHLIELPCYLLALWLLIRTLGIEGAAIAWSARAVFDALALFVMARKFLAADSAMALKTKMLLAAAAATLLLATLPEGPVVKAGFLVVSTLVFVLVGWFLILSHEERSLAQNHQ